MLNKHLCVCVCACIDISAVFLDHILLSLLRQGLSFDQSLPIPVVCLLLRSPISTSFKIFNHLFTFNFLNVIFILYLWVFSLHVYLCTGIGLMRESEFLELEF